MNTSFQCNLIAAPPTVTDRQFCPIELILNVIYFLVIFIEWTKFYLMPTIRQAY